MSKSIPIGIGRRACGWLPYLLLLFSPGSHAEDWDKRMQESGMVDVRTLDSTIQVRLAYATPVNFMSKAVYQGATRAWLHPDAARMLVKAQQYLREEHPGYTLLVYDAARPMAVQRLMWEQVRGTPRAYYVSNPQKKSGRHNYGMAVDVTILDHTGRPLPMGTLFDYFGVEANTDKEEALLQSGRINREDYENRRLLRRVMRRAGFTTISSEWWHFNACSSRTAQQKYKRIE
ncbi:MAG: M15 family metallopeptidase [Tannerella sp.]|nr:M15 family metallopeptidase [Tannerella sp.]